MKQILTILLFCALVCQFGCVSRELKRKAAEGDKVAQNDLGHIYETTLSYDFFRSPGSQYYSDYDSAVKWYRMSAEQGYATAQNNLGRMYRDGVGGTKNYDEALKWFRKAAEQGNAAAQNNLGVMYQQGQGVSQNYDEAMKWYRMAAEQGHAAAQLNLGNMYQQGRGVPQDYAEALKWLRMAADQGNEDAKKRINETNERINERNEFEAKIVIARQGDPIAQNRVGVMYFNGTGVAQNYVEAMSWFFEAAEQGYVWAQSNLAKSYRNGDGTTKDEVEALAWFYVANSHPEKSTVSDLGDNIASLERRVGADGRLAAQQRAKELSAMLKPKE